MGSSQREESKEERLTHGSTPNGATLVSEVNLKGTPSPFVFSRNSESASAPFMKHYSEANSRPSPGQGDVSDDIEKELTFFKEQVDQRSQEKDREETKIQVEEVAAKRFDKAVSGVEMRFDSRHMQV